MTNTEISIRVATPADAPEAIDVVRDSITNLCVADHQNDSATLETWLANKTVPSFVSWISNHENFCVGAESDGRLLGVGNVHRRGEILLFYLRPEAQRRGIGRLINASLEAQAAKCGLATLRLESTSAARPFYESLGYRASGSARLCFGVLRTFPYAKQLTLG